MKLTSILIILLFAFTLAACGGGGSSGPAATDGMDPDGMDDDMAMEECPAGHTGTYPDCVDPAVEAAEKAKIMGLTAAIADPDGDDKLSEADELTNSARPSATIMLAAGGTITVIEGSVNDMLGKNDTNIPNAQEFQKASQSRIGLGNGYEVSVYQRTKAKKMDTLTVYSNVMPAGSAPWNTHTWPADSGLSADGGEGATNETKTTYNVVTFSTTAPIDSDVVGRMTGSGIPPGAGTNRGIKADDDFSGTLYGVPGKYACSDSGACTLTRDADGDLMVTGAFTFTPSETVTDTDDMHMVEGVILDPDYLIFGYWMQEQEATQGTKYGVGVFAEGNQDYTVSRIATLQGTATYEGPATGMYAKKDLSVEGGEVVGTPSAVGQFSADASLTAHFGSTDSGTPVNGSDKISPAEALTVSGTIDNFMDAGGDMINANWSLSLDAAELDGVNTDGDAFNGDTTGTGGTGKWSGQFYGNPPTTTPATPQSQMYPQSVAGEFTGHFEDGHVIGAFGATR